VCLDAGSSTCGAATQPTLLLIDPPTGAVYAQSGGPRVPVSNSQSINVNGQGYDQGLVTLSIDTVGGTVIATAFATGGNGAATFTVPINTGLFPIGDHQLVGWETVGGTTLQASVLLTVEALQ
jgi:hypothetical protein